MNAVSLVWFRTRCPRNRDADYYTMHWPYLLRVFPLLYPNWRLYWIVQREQEQVVRDAVGDRSFVHVHVTDIDRMSVGHLMRLMPLWDLVHGPEEDEVLACNDCDSVPSLREAIARHEFANGPLNASVIRDCWEHRGQMLGGLCAWRARVARNRYPSFVSFISGHEPKDEWQFSQWYTKENLWEKVVQRESRNHAECMEMAVRDGERAKPLPEARSLPWLPASFCERFYDMVPICGGLARDYEALDGLLSEYGW